MKKVLKVFSAFAVVGVTAVGLASCGGSAKNYAAKNTKFKIGVSGPLTGDAAVYGLGVKNSAQLAVDEINANGGVNGVQLELVAKDDECLADKAATNYTSLYEDGMQFSLGGVTSGACLEFASYANKDKVFCLTPSATNDDVPKTGDNVYQMCFSDSGQGSAAAAYISKNYPDAKVGVFYDSSDAYSKGIYDNFKKVVSNTTDAAFTKDTNTSFTSQIQTLKNCDFIFMPIYYSQAALFIEQAKDTFGKNVVYFGCDGLDGIDSVEGFNPNSYPQEISYLSHFNAASDDEAVVSFVTKYTAAYGKDTLNQFGASAYDCVYAMVGALKAAASKGTKVEVTMSPKEVYEVLKGEFQGGYSFSGVTGKNVTWDEGGTVNKTPGKFVVNPGRAK